MILISLSGLALAFVIGGLVARSDKKEGEPVKPETLRPTTTPPRSSVNSAPRRPQSPAYDFKAREAKSSAGTVKDMKAETNSVNISPATTQPASPAPPATRQLENSQSTGEGIFISYRRQDEPNFAGRLYDRLVGRFGKTNVFIDVDTIELGLDFGEVIDQSLSQCKIMIVVIGKSWLRITDEDGDLRLGWVLGYANFHNLLVGQPML